MAVLRARASGTESGNVLVWGASGSGLSHLLQATCHAAGAADRSALFLPLEQFPDVDPEQIVDGLEHCPLICIDNLDVICGRSEWEHALFHLFNRARESGASLVLSCHRAATEMPVILPDLRSRLLGCGVWQLPDLSDDDKCEVLRKRAGALGMTMDVQIANYIVHRSSRDMRELMRLLKVLDNQSLRKKRKLSLALVRETLALEDPDHA